ncbi:MAG: MBL fold metallo-hydrolase [Peptostreptococcaceae bacterium]|nr:MBL fold metallo-hydrolase [Peptostreptococcaceae bacterium]
MKIKFCGASFGVTGSCHLITTEKHKVLLDCGQFQGGKSQNALNYEPFQFEPSEIESVILSHAHIDHCGRLPLLVKRGFRGSIYCTSATADLLEIMLRDSAYIHEKDAEWDTKRALRAGKPPVEPLYTVKDAVEALKYVKPILYDQIIDINDEMRIVFNDAGHILGSAITELWVRENNKDTKIVFSGDLGVMDRPILRNPTIIKKADYVIMESTYGNRLHPKNSTSLDELLSIILKTVKRGGTVVIPSFAVGRTQELIYQLDRFYDENKEVAKQLEDVKVYIDSPMATSATEVFKKNADVFDEETKAYLQKGDNPLDFKNLLFTRSTEDSRMLNMDNTPKIIISASGMCEAGRIRHHLKHNLWNKKSSIVFVGYQAQGTLGRRIVEGEKDVTLFGEDIHVDAEIYNLEGFSGHADRDGLEEWLAGFVEEPKKVFLVHGEMDSKREFATYVKEKLNIEPIVVEGLSEFELDGTVVLNESAGTKEGLSDSDIQLLRNKISNIGSGIDNVLYNAKLITGAEISPDKLIRINNIVQELEKASINLGAVITEEDRSIEELNILKSEGRL